MINKNIITTLPDKKKIPRKVYESIKDTKIKNPHWNMIIYDHADIEKLINTKYKKYKKYFYAINEIYYIARIDFFKVIFIYEEGGIWFDAKTKINIPLDDFVEKYDTVITYYLLNKNKYKLGNGVFAAKKKNKYIEKILYTIMNNIENYDNIKREYDFNNIRCRRKVFYITGMAIFRYVFNKINNKQIKKIIDMETITWTIFEPNNKAARTLKFIHRKALNIKIKDCNQELITKKIK